MRKKEKEWHDWFLAEFEYETRRGDRGPVDERVPWDKIEEKGIELGIVRMDEPGWFTKLRSKWQKIMPRKWCEELADSIDRGIELRRPGSPVPRKQQVQRPWYY